MLKSLLRDLVRRFRGELLLDDYRKAGARIAGDVLANGLTINKNDCFLITIEAGVVLGPNVLILAHDASLRPEVGFTRVAPVKIGSGSFVGARAVLLPGSTIGRNCIIAAGSVVAGSIESDSVYGGVPAKRLGSKSDHLKKWQTISDVGPKFAEGWKADVKVEHLRDRMRDEIGEGNGWVY